MKYVGVLFAYLCVMIWIKFGELADTTAISNGESGSSISIQNLNILSRIQARFATTWVSSRMKNSAKNATEVVFFTQIPDAAFITNFSMQIDDKIIYGNVKEKEEAKKDFDAAKARGESAGLVAKKPRESNIFQINVNLAAESKVTFNLTYQEILQRVHGVYKHVIDVQPNYPTELINIEVIIQERGEIVDLTVPRFEEKLGDKTNKELISYAAEKDAVIERSIASNQSMVTVKFSPQSKQQQQKSGQFVVLYEVKRDSNSAGSIEVVEGYFVHFFAPQGLPKGNKRIVFVLDKSGSMIGRKFDQLKVAMKVMLNDLNPDDIFNIIFFSTKSELWKTESIKASADNIKAAQLFVADTEAQGSTDIHGSLSLALKVLDQAGPATSAGDDTLLSTVLFLTDGQPTEGLTDPTAILNNVTESNSKQQYVINCIGFGDDADMLLMKRISSKNRGLAKKIYEDSDAALQLTGFYDQISNPVLSRVNITYLNDTVDVGSLVFSGTGAGGNFFEGGEIVAVGKLKSGPDDAGKSSNDLRAEISASGSAGRRVSLSGESSRWICPRWGNGCCPRPVPWGGVGPSFHDHYPCCWGPRCPPPFPWPQFTTPAPKQPPPPNTLGGFVERMWAYQTVKKLLKEVELDESKDASKKEATKKKALDLSLKYRFVNDLTSMVVVQSNDTTKKQQLEKIDKIPIATGLGAGQAGPWNSRGGARSFAGAPPPPRFGGGIGRSVGIAGPIGGDADMVGTSQFASTSTGNGPIDGRKPSPANGKDAGAAGGEKKKTKEEEAKSEAKEVEKAKPIVDTDKKDGKKKCQQRIYIVSDTDLEKSSEAEATNKVIDQLTVKFLANKDSTYFFKSKARLIGSKPKINVTHIVEAASQIIPGNQKDVPLVLLIFAPAKNMDNWESKEIKDYGAKINAKIVVVAWQQYPGDYGAKLKDIAGGQLLVKPDVDQIVKSLPCP